MDNIIKIPEDSTTNAELRGIVRQLVEAVNDLYAERCTVQNQPTLPDNPKIILGCSIPYHVRISKGYCRNTKNNGIGELCDQVVYLDEQGKVIEDIKENNETHPQT